MDNKYKNTFSVYSSAIKAKKKFHWSNKSCVFILRTKSVCCLFSDRRNICQSEFFSVVVAAVTRRHRVCVCVSLLI